MTNLKDKKLRVSMSDGSIWETPISVVIENRAKAFEDEHDTWEDAVEESNEYFSYNNYNIKDWVISNCIWYELKFKQVEEAAESNYAVMWDSVDTYNLRIV